MSQPPKMKCFCSKKVEMGWKVLQREAQDILTATQALKMALAFPGKTISGNWYLLGKTLDLALRTIPTKLSIIVTEWYGVKVQL